MEKLKKLIGLLCFTIHDGFEHKKNLSKISFNFPKPDYENFLTNKYLTLLNLKIYFFNIIKYLTLPIFLILKTLNYKIISVNPHSIGSCVEELDAVIKKNLNQENYKLILFCPKLFSDNIPVIKTLFSKNIFLLHNPFWCILIIPLSFFKSITISPYFKKNYNEKVVFPKQYYYAKKNYVNFSYENFAHFILFKELLKSEDAKNKINLEKNLDTHSNYFNKLKELHDLKGKTCVIHLRNENTYKHRNMNIDNYYLTFDFLLNNNYKIILYYNSEISEKFNDKIFHIKKLNDKDKFNQLLFIYNCDLYIGNYSGPFHIADIFKNDTIVLDTVVFNHFVRKKNFINVPKKYYDGKHKKFLKIDQIFNKNIECVWDKKILKNLEIDPIELNDKEILEIVKFYFRKDKNFFNLSEFSFYKDIPYNKNLAINYIPKIDFLKDIFDK